MNLNEKNAILEKTRDRLQKTCAKIVAKINCTKEDLRRSEEKFSRLSNADKLVESKIISYNEKRINELNYLKGSPYFVRCQVRYDKENKETSLNFGKFSFTDDLIYSWIAPASSIRFEEPGDFEYKCPDGNIEKGKLLRKDQFMIVNGEIRFLSTEGLNSPRELIYQEHFSNRKTGFVLPLPAGPDIAKGPT
jgi:DNA helicase IV